MVNVKRILVPVDLSGDTMGVAKEALVIAGEFGAETLFLHAREGAPSPEEPPRPAADEALSCLDSLLAGRAGRVILIDGPPARRIPEVARQERVDLIVMATRGAKGPRRWFSPSVTQRVLRDAPCPVWTSTTHRALAPGHPVRNILCAVSLGPRSKKVLRWAAGLAEQLDAKLNVVHTSGDFAAAPHLPASGEWDMWMRARAMVEIRNMQIGDNRIERVWLEPGSPREAVPALAQRVGSDLIIVGRSPLSRLFPGLRAQSYDIVCQAPCPVASV